MRKLHYAGGWVIIDDQVCKAILRYARALAKAETSDLVVFPALTEEHVMGIAHILIGPASQIISVPTSDIGLDLKDSRFVEILESRTLNLDPERPEWGKDIVDVTDFTSFDWDLESS